MHNLHAKQHVEFHIYCFCIFWHHFWLVLGRKKPAQEMFTFVSSNVQDCRTAPLKSVPYTRIICILCIILLLKSKKLMIQSVQCMFEYISLFLKENVSFSMVWTWHVTARCIYISLVFGNMEYSSRHFILRVVALVFTFNYSSCLLYCRIVVSGED